MDADQSFCDVCRTELVEKCYYAPLGIAPAALPDTCDGVRTLRCVIPCRVQAHAVCIESARVSAQLTFCEIPGRSH